MGDGDGVHCEEWQRFQCNFATPTPGYATLLKLLELNSLNFKNEHLIIYKIFYWKNIHMFILSQVIGNSDFTHVDKNLHVQFSC